MRKNDITLRNHRAYPAINIKWWGFVPDMLHFKDAGHEFSGPEYADFWTWVEASWDKDEFSDMFNSCDEMAREMQYDDAKEEIVDYLNLTNRQVYSDGRSGGWIVAEGLGEVEDWDAVAVSRWSHACNIAKRYLNEMDYQFIWHLFVNYWEPFQEVKSKESRRHTVTLTFVANGVTDEHWTSMLEDVETFATSWACDHAAMLDDDTYQLEID